MTPDLASMGCLDVAAAYRRLADVATRAAVDIVNPDLPPGLDEAGYAAVEAALLTVAHRRGLLAAARRGAARGRRAAA